MRRLGLLIAGFGLAATSALATDVPVPGLKLIVVDKIAAANKAKVVFVAKDPTITKGTSTDATQIEATLHVAFDSVSGQFFIPQGSNWLANSSSVAKYVNKTAPTGGSVKVAVVKPGSLVKVVAKSLGDNPLSISSAPSGPVYVANATVNGGEETRVCTQFTACEHKVIAGGTGYKLICKGSSTGDPDCTAVVPTTTSTSLLTTTTTTSSTSTSSTTSSTSTSTSTTTSSTTSTTICFQDLGDGTILDTCTGLQWEKKTTTVGSGVNAADLHDVDNRYLWAGTCSLNVPKYCQPNLAAETACKAQTDMAHWASGCEQCTGGEGTCTVPAPIVTTVWDWLTQVNAASYAGHSDWRLPSESGCNSCFNGLSCTSCSAHELETILLSSPPVICPSPCIDSIFGPTAPTNYRSATTSAGDPTRAWDVSFLNRGVLTNHKTLVAGGVRAVRGAVLPSTTSTTLATTTTTTSTTTSSTIFCAATSGAFCDLGDGTVYDAATGLQWEKKTTTVGSGVNAADLHDVDNTYSWAGQCSVTSTSCQPNLAAETACKAQTDMAHWASGCEQCTGGDGACNVNPFSFGAITTVWDWLAQMNAANYAGHNDWRLPSESGCNTCYTNGAGGFYECTSCNGHELETILLSPYACGTSPCIDSIFGPTAAYYYWSASTHSSADTHAWFVYFLNGLVNAGFKPNNLDVRAVRGGS